MIYRDLSAINPLVNVRLGVAVEVVLGSPKKNCRGIGICRIERAGMVMEGVKKCTRSKALLFTKSEHALYIYFIKHSLASSCWQKQISRGAFQIPESVILPIDLNVELGFCEHAAIDRGTYPVTDLGTHLSIAVRIQPGMTNLPSFH